MKSILKKSLLLLATILMLAGYSAKSQLLTDLTFSVSQGSWQQSTGWTVLAYVVDDGSYYVSLPFQFKFDNYYNTYVYMSSNGHISFYPYYGYYNLTNFYLTYTYASVQVMKRDLYVYNGMGYEVQGVAPNRVMIFQWLGVDFYYGYGANMNFQVKLYETSNRIDIVFGPMNYGNFPFQDYYFYAPHLGFTGTVNTRYINIEPGPTFVAHFSNRNPEPRYTSSYIVSSQIASYCTQGLTISLTAFPSLVDVWPQNGTILRRGNIYDGTGGTMKPGMYFSRITGQADVYGRYQISGPLPADPRRNPQYKVIYTGTKVGNPTDELVYFSPQPVGQPAFAPIPAAKGIAAGSNGALDLLTNRSQIPGGEYMVEARMELPSFNYVQPIDPVTFVIANDYDLAITSLISPRSKNDRKYPLSVSIPLQARILNIGIATIDSFVASVTVRKVGGDIELVDTVRWPSVPNTPGLTTGQGVQINFKLFRPRDVGDYEVVVTATPTYPPYDDETYNNRYPRSGETFVFNVAYDVEAEAKSIIVPEDSVFVGRPFRVRAIFQNNGVAVISDAPAYAYIVKMTPPYDTVFRTTTIIQDIPTGRNNITTVIFPDNFIPPSAGTYKICVGVKADGDPIETNDEYCKLFQVVHAMAGTYTIGTTYLGNPRNYPTIQDALNDLYKRGVTGPVVFELTDAFYEVGNINAPLPAIDLTSKIIGVSPENTITFKPSIMRSLSRGAVTIKLNSGAGIGVLIGQNASPSNSYAPVLEVVPSIIRKYANSDGYFIFDGGKQKSLRFALNTNNTFRAVFYLANGASNITIQNCIIENYDNNNISKAISLPLGLYNTALSMFQFQDDKRSATETYSAGIVLRSKTPTDKDDPTANTFNLDTIPNTNNIIKGNEINGFGYGIVSLGIGPLFNAGKAVYQRYYNKNNLYAENKIYDVARAGIFLGNEEGSIVRNNRIYNVNAPSGWDAAGILVGGQRRSGFNGYNNIGLQIIGNEISGVNSAVAVWGIKVEQARNAYPFINPPQVFFPDVNENVKIANNVVWGLTTSAQTAHRAGIYLLTERGAYLEVPYVTGYYTRNDEIVNNTVVIQNISSITNGYVAGIGIQSAKNTVVKNNAIALMDMNVDPNNQVYACIFYEGMMPSEMGLTSDRNAFWYANGSGGTVVRFVETDKNDNILDNGGNRNDFATLEQWQNWTGMDGNSVFGNFTNDFVYLGYEPNQRLRIATNPTPLGSILNNRGERIDWVTHDIDGNIRGAAGQRYDIGAVEFEGRLYLSDLEMIKITYPAKYQSSTGMFNDAQYVMDNTPTNVKALVRNSGNLQQSAVNVTVNIYREMADGSFNVVPEVTATKQVTLASGESVEVDFGLNDGQAPDFKPKTYGELANEGYYVPDQFLTMQANVTPRYKIVVSLSGDQQNANNTVSKVVRYYIPQSKTRALLSVENSMVQLDANSTADEIAGRLNYDSLVAAFRKLGWMIDITEGIFDFDIFDRKGWEPKAVDYRLFNSILWSDGDDKALTRQEKIDLRRFLTSGTVESKKNLVISSQEIVRANAADAEFLRGLLRAKNVAPGNPKGANVSNDGNDVIGLAVGRKLAMKIKRTGYSGDVEPYCGLMAVESTGEGQALAGGYYREHQGSTTDSIAGIATTTLTRNVVLFGVDWRHWGRIDMIIRGILDYVNANGGFIIPVELSEFDAKAVGNAVYVRWATESEYNTSKFEVERAEMRGAVKSEFEKVGEEKAAGTSTSRREYGPVVDRGVEFGKEYMYRLKVVDIDGATSYSREVMVKMEGEANWVGEVMPNPGVNEISFELSAVEGARVEAKLIDLAGRELKRVYTGVGNGNVVKVVAGVSELPSGVYTLVVKIGNETITRSVNIVK
ncbi:MAG: T9SS type A sorting domain-containing protein [Candidatus Kapaibacteriota bacterium]